MAEQKMEIRGITVYWSRKRIKNLYIKIKAPEARVMVSVPLHTSDRALADFIEEHWQWIEAKRQEVLSGAEAGGSEGQREYISGERHALWGEWYEMRVERSLKRPLTELRDRELYMRVPAHSTVEERRRQLDLWYRQQLEEALPEVAARCEARVGREAAEWRFRRMKTRWGSCNIQKKRIWLNIQLAEKPADCLEYVVTHELTHLHEAGHNKRFWGLMDTFYPDWRRAKKLLNE